MKNLKIAHQLFALLGVLMAAFAVATYFQIRSQADSIYDDRFDMLRTQVEIRHIRFESILRTRKVRRDDA